MASNKMARFLPIALVIIIIIIIIAAIVSLTRVFFSGSENNDTPTVTDNSRQALLSTNEGRSVRMTVRGPIVATEEFSSYQIDISPNGRKIETYRGYMETVIEQNALDNNVAAYEEFVHALDKANLPKGEELDGDRDDVRGVCATGRLYEFTILNDGEPVKHLWTSTCRGSRGSLDASVAQLSGLFVKQIPDADRLIRSVRL